MPSSAGFSTHTGVLLLLLLVAGYVIVKSRNDDKTNPNKDPEKGTNLCLMNSHYIIMPTVPCTGVDDDRTACTGTNEGPAGSSCCSEAFWCI
jgi:hypothetical protein